MIRHCTNELLVATGTDSVEVFELTPPKTLSSLGILLKTPNLPLAQYYPTHRFLLLAQPHSATFLFRLETAADSITLKHHMTLWLPLKKLDFHHNILLSPAVRPGQYFLSAACPYNGYSKRNRFFSILFDSQRKEMLQAFYLRSSHENDLSCIAHRTGSNIYYLGDDEGYVSVVKICWQIPQEKKRVKKNGLKIGRYFKEDKKGVEKSSVKNESKTRNLVRGKAFKDNGGMRDEMRSMPRFFKREILKPTLVCNAPIYFLKFSSVSNFLIAGDPEGMARVLHPNNLHCLAEISLQSLLTSTFFVEAVKLKGFYFYFLIFNEKYF